MAESFQDASIPLVRGSVNGDNRGALPLARRHRATLLGLAVVSAVAVVVVMLAVSGSDPAAKHAVGKAKPSDEFVGVEAIEAACRATFYPEVCSHTLLLKHRAYSANPQELTKMMVSSATHGVKNTLAAVLANRGTNSLGFAGERVCHQTLISSVEQLDFVHSTLAASSSLDVDLEPATFDDLKTKLSAALEFHTTCIDALMETGALESHTVETKERTEKLLSNALAFVNSLSRFGNRVHSWAPITDSEFSSTIDAAPVVLSRKSLMTPSMSKDVVAVVVEEEEAASFPSWMSSEQQQSFVGAPTCDVVVAKDGSGKFKSIQSAVDAAPKTSSDTAKRYVVCIKAGVYNEQVTVPKSATNFMFFGDGTAKSIITGDRSVALTPGMTTFNSATLIIEGSGFIGQAFTARNTAGAAGHQAVAMRVSADKAAFYQCTFDSWQDTLYTHTLRQYYRECYITGTVDFIFGNGPVAFQACTIVAKKSTILGQQNTYSAQGKTDPGQNTGYSFQSCTFDGTADLKANTAQYKTYLGRPWKEYSTHVNLKCNLIGHIDPAGWLPWNTSDFGLKTSFFAEWLDFGAGANTAKRVSWSHQITDKNVAQRYQAVPFAGAGSWVPATGIPLTTSLP